MSNRSPDSTDRLSAPWGHHDLEVGGERAVRLGPLELRMKRTDQEIWLTQHRIEDEAGPAEADPDWSRWAIPEGTTGVRLEPVFPDRALVVEPEQAFHLVRGARVRVYVRVPLWVSVGLP